MNALQILAAVSLVFCPLLSEAQNDSTRNKEVESAEKAFLKAEKSAEKKTAKIESYVEKDKYKKAIKKGKNLVQQFEKNSEEESSASYRASQALAQAYFTSGSVVAAQSALEKAKEEFENLNKSNTRLGTSLGLKQASLLFTFGKYNETARVLKEYLQTARPQNEKEQSDLVSASILLNKALVAQGYLQAAEQLEQGISASIQTRWTPTGDKSLLKGLKKPEKERRVKQYFEAQLAKAERLMQQGKYSEAYDFLGEQRKAFRKLSKKSSEKVSYYEDMALIAIGLGDLGNANGFFEDALDYQLKAHSEINPHSIRLMSACMQTLSDLEKERRYNEFCKQNLKALGYYRKSKSSLNTLPILFAEIKHKLSQEKYKDADKQANQLAELALRYKATPHPVLLWLNSNLYAYYLSRDAYAKAELLMLNALEQTETLYGAEAPIVDLRKLRNADFLVNFRYQFKETNSVLNGKTWDNYLANFSEYHPQYLQFLNTKAYANSLNDDIEKQLANLQEAQNTAKRTYGENSTAYANELVLLAEANLAIGKYAEVQEMLNVAIPIIERNEGRKALAYLTASRILAEFYENTGKLEIAKDIYRKTFKKLDKSNKKSGTSSSAQPEKLAQVYMLTGDFKAAQELLDKSLEQKGKLFGNDALPLVEPHTLLAKLFYIQGNYIKSQQEAQLAKTIGKKYLNENSLKLLQVNKLLADIDYALGDYKSAAHKLKQTLATQQKLLGSENPEVANTAIKLAQADYYSGGDLSTNKTLVSNAVLTLEQTAGEKALQTANAYVYKGLFEMESGDMVAAQKALDMANDIYLVQLKKGNENEGKISRIQGDIFTRQKDYTQALERYQKAANIYEKLFNDEHPEYLKCLSKLAHTEAALGKYASALKKSDYLVGQYQNFAAVVFPYLSEREKSKYWTQLKNDFDFYYALVAETARNDKKQLTKVLERRMQTKALLLNASIAFQNDVRNSKSEELKALFDEWYSFKKQYASTLFLSKQELADAGIDPVDIDSKAASAEKELSAKLYGKTTKNDKDLKTLRKSLKENEVLVECIRYNGVINTESVGYAQLIVDKKELKMLVFDNGLALEKPFYNYFRNATKLKALDKYSYASFWGKLDSAIADNKKVYFSPDGVYNLINPEILKDEEGKYIIEKNQVVLLNNPAEAIVTEVKAKNKKNQVKDTSTTPLLAELVGNPDFYAIPNSGGKNGLKALPGTGEEISEIEQVLGNKGIETASLTGGMALESDVKKLQSPKILHFATHGYFEDQEGEKVQDGIKEEETGKHPLLMSGLMLSNSGDLMSKQGTSEFYTTDGVLTAFEARDIALYGTDMVVLSACETGLGQVSAGEGVYGLQRAFQDAGAKSVLMSLFKVDDQATKELMVAFYTNWLQNGNKQQALRQAKLALKEKYPDPVNWGAFIMVGN